MVSGGWLVILPVRELKQAKSRLTSAKRAEFALAFLRDVTAILADSTEVESVVVATPDPTIERKLRGCEVVADPGTGINSAVEVGKDWARSVGHRGPVMAMLPDLPSARGREFDAMQRLARRYERAFVPDSVGTGTTCVTASRVGLLETAFGEHSARIHRARRYTELTGTGLGLRQDVDTLRDLASAIDLGVGRFTSAVAGS